MFQDAAPLSVARDVREGRDHVSTVDDAGLQPTPDT